jgi:hypothetical protein
MSAVPDESAMPSEFRYVIPTLALLGLCMATHGGRVLVLPVLFILLLELLYWAAKPGPEE